MTSEATSFTSGLRRPLLLRTMFNVLGESSEPRPAGDVLDEVATTLSFARVMGSGALCVIAVGVSAPIPR